MTIFAIIIFLIILLISSAIWGLILVVVKLFEYHRLKKRIIPLKHQRRIIRWITFGCLVLFSLLQTYTAFHPLDKFYISKFELNTAIGFPESGKIIKKDSSYPDFHGDYWAAAVINFSSADYDSVLKQLDLNPDFIIDSTRQGIGVTTEYQDLVKDIDEDNIVRIYQNKTKEWFKVAFLNDRKTIIFERSST